MATPDQLAKIATRLRHHVLRMTTAAGSGHPTSCMSMAEITSVLFFHEMRYNIKHPNDWGNDEFVLSKGHAAPILWAAYAEAGIIPLNSLLTLRKADSPFEGHPTPRMPWVKVATGSLGQGLPAAVGMAWAMRHGKSPGRVYCILGDGECAEGSVWEAANVASHENLTNIVAIVDLNRLGQTGPTMHEHDANAYISKFKAFGWEAVAIDGHDISELVKVLVQARSATKPFAIIAKTLKGKGVSFMENVNGWHGKATTPAELEKAIKEIGLIPEIESKKLVHIPPKTAMQQTAMQKFSWKGTFAPTAHLKPSDPKPSGTRDGFGRALVTLGKMHEGIIAVDAEVRNSTKEEWFFKEFPNRSINCFIAEQAMAGIAMGLAAKGYIPFPSTFACFLTRASDFIRMAGIAGLNIKFVGSHAGVSIGEDGPSQMGLEDLSMFRAVPTCVILYPSDALSAEFCTALLARHNGMGYIRTARMETPIIYSQKYPPKEGVTMGNGFSIGGSKVLKSSPKDVVTIVAAGVTVHEALAAHDELKKQKINIRVVDAYSIQPLDVKTLTSAAEETNGKVIVVEDHYQAGGLGEAVAMALSGIATVKHLCIREAPRSGNPRELMKLYGIDATSITRHVKSMLQSKTTKTTGPRSLHSGLRARKIDGDFRWRIPT